MAGQARQPRERWRCKCTLGICLVETRVQYPVRSFYYLESCTNNRETNRNVRLDAPLGPERANTTTAIEAGGHGAGGKGDHHAVGVKVESQARSGGGDEEGEDVEEEEEEGDGANTTANGAGGDDTVGKDDPAVGVKVQSWARSGVLFCKI